MTGSIWTILWRFSIERPPERVARGLTRKVGRATQGDGTWSPYDVIGHLIHGERANWTPRVQHILAGERRPFEPFDRAPQFTKYQGKSVGELLEAFAELRRENVAALVGMHLTGVDLSRMGQHPEFGEVRLGQLLVTWVVHDLVHAAQIVRTMAKVYAEAVGSWRAYLSILQDRE